MRKTILKFLVFTTGFILLLVFQFKLIIAGYSYVERYTALKKLLSEFKDKTQDSKFIFHSIPEVDSDTVKVNLSYSDARSANLKKFIRKYNPNSPLYDLTDYIVEVSDKYGLDYRLLVAIAMQESNLCKKIPKDSYNCWGWGIYGNKITKFKSYEEAIETVAKGLRENYVDKGHYTIYTIMKKYNPSSNGSWGNAVKKFFLMLE